MSAPADAHPSAAPAAHAEEDPAAGLDASAALLRAESAHLDATLHALAHQLAAIPGLVLSVGHRQGRLRRLLGDLPYLNDLHRDGAAIETLAARAGAHSYTLRAGAGSLLCTREQVQPSTGGAGGTREQVTPSAGGAGGTREQVTPSAAGAGGTREELSFEQWATALFGDIERQNLANHDALRALRQLVERGAAQ